MTFDCPVPAGDFGLDYSYCLMFHRRREFLRLRLALADMIITAASFGMAYVLRQHLPSMREFYLLGPTLIGLLLSAIVIWPVAGWTVGVSRKAGGNDTTQLVAAIIKQAVWSTAALVSLLYLAKLGDISRSFVLLFIGINTVLLLAWRLSPLMGVAAGAKRHFVIVGIGEDAWNVAQLIESIGNRSSEIVAF